MGTNTPGTAGTPRPGLPHPTVWVAALLVPFVDYLLHQQGALMLATVLGYVGYRSWHLRGAVPYSLKPTATPADSSSANLR